jgi:predicted dehydrogenase
MHTDRRRFFQAAATTAVSASRILGANDRIRLGAIGVGGRGTYDLGLAAKADNTQIVAVCDVYEPRLAAVKQRLAPHGAAYADYRELLDRNDIDAVIIASPDHWHAPMIIDSIQAGKDVYCEKPVCHSIAEGQRLLAEAAASKQIVQIGYQQRSWEHFKEAQQMIASGKLGRVALIVSHWYQGYRKLMSNRKPADPAKIDWNRFLGDAPKQPFDPIRCAYWRWFWDFGGGHLTDLFSHWVDVIHWCMGEDTPRSAQTTGARNVFPEFECPDTISAAYEYPGGFCVIYNGSLVGSLEAGGIVFHGSEALMRLNRSGFAYWEEGAAAFEKPDLPPPKASARATSDGTIAHMQNFLDCVRTRAAPNAPLASSVAAARAAHIGNLAYRERTARS